MPEARCWTFSTAKTCMNRSSLKEGSNLNSERSAAFVSGLCIGALGIRDFSLASEIAPAKRRITSLSGLVSRFITDGCYWIARWFSCCKPEAKTERAIAAMAIEWMQPIGSLRGTKLIALDEACFGLLLVRFWIPQGRPVKLLFFRSKNSHQN